MGPSDVGGIIRQEERYGRRDLHAGTNTAQRNARVGHHPSALGVTLRHLGIDDSWLQFVHSDALTTILDRSAPGNTSDAMLGPDIIARQRAAIGEDARNVDD